MCSSKAAKKGVAAAAEAFTKAASRSSMCSVLSPCTLSVLLVTQASVAVVGSWHAGTGARGGGSVGNQKFVQSSALPMVHAPPPSTQPGASSGQAGSQPQLSVVEAADASVENQPLKPTMPGFMTGHFL